MLRAELIASHTFGTLNIEYRMCKEKIETMCRYSVRSLAYFTDKAQVSQTSEECAFDFRIRKAMRAITDT